METTKLDTELLDDLLEQQLLGFSEAAGRDLVLVAENFGFARRTMIWARLALLLFERLSPLEQLVVGLRFGADGPGVTRRGAAAFLQLPVGEVARMEYAIAERFCLSEEAA